MIGRKNILSMILVFCTAGISPSFAENASHEIKKNAYRRPNNSAFYPDNSKFDDTLFNNWGRKEKSKSFDLDEINKDLEDRWLSSKLYSYPQKKAKKSYSRNYLYAISTSNNSEIKEHSFRKKNISYDSDVVTKEQNNLPIEKAEIKNSSTNKKKVDNNEERKDEKMFVDAKEINTQDELINVEYLEPIETQSRESPENLGSYSAFPIIMASIASLFLMFVLRRVKEQTKTEDEVEEQDFELPELGLTPQIQTQKDMSEEQNFEYPELYLARETDML